MCKKTSVLSSAPQNRVHNLIFVDAANRAAAPMGMPKTKRERLTDEADLE